MYIQFCSIGGASFVINIDGSLKIACDPVLGQKDTVFQFKSFNSVRLKEPVYDNYTFEKDYRFGFYRVHYKKASVFKFESTGLHYIFI